MNCTTPITGSESIQGISFGNDDVTIGNVKGGTDETSYVGGKWNTQQCLSKVAKQDQYICEGITNSPEIGYCAPACCCVSYSTPGTKSGDWYLPMPGELYQIYANKTVINKKRKELIGSEFINWSYWSSRETDRNSEYFVNLNNGLINYNTKTANNRYVLGFLALEV